MRTRNERAAAADHTASLARMRAWVRKKKKTSSRIANDMLADVSQNALQSRVMTPVADVLEK